MGNVKAELEKLKGEEAKLTEKKKELKKLGVEAAEIYRLKRDNTHTTGLIDRMNGCSIEQDLASDFADKILHASNVDGKPDVEVNDAAKREFKKIMNEIKSLHCEQTEKALSGSLQQKKKTNAPIQDAINMMENTKNRTAAGSGGALRRTRRSRKSRKRRAKRSRRTTKRVKRRRTRRKRTRRRR